MRVLLLLPAVVAFVVADPTLQSAVQGLHCAKNQAVNKVTYFEDGSIEAECGPIPCGESGASCIEEQTECKQNTRYVFSGMKWAPNGQSISLRCCSLQAGTVMYVGTDKVNLGSFYAGGPVKDEDKYGHGGAEYDFVSNIRAEQGGIRIWVHRIMCASDAHKPEERESVRRAPARVDATPTNVVDPRDAAQRRRERLLAQLAESRDAPAQSVPSEPQNPLRYHPLHMRDQPLPVDARLL